MLVHFTIHSDTVCSVQLTMSFSKLNDDSFFALAFSHSDPKYQRNEKIVRETLLTEYQETLKIIDKSLKIHSEKQHEKSKLFSETDRVESVVNKTSKETSAFELGVLQCEDYEYSESMTKSEKQSEKSQSEKSLSNFEIDPNDEKSEEPISQIEACTKYDLPPYMTDSSIKNQSWNYTSLYVDAVDEKSELFSEIQLQQIERRHPVIDFCHPGPVIENHFFVDSIVQKLFLKNIDTPYVVVRWVGYEDW